MHLETEEATVRHLEYMGSFYEHHFNSQFQSGAWMTVSIVNSSYFTIFICV